MTRGQTRRFRHLLWFGVIIFTLKALIDGDKDGFMLILGYIIVYIGTEEQAS